MNAIYRLGLISGHYRRSIRVPSNINDLAFKSIFPFPTKEQLRITLGPAGVDALINEADEIADGMFHMFGGPLVPIQISPAGPLPHWTECETGKNRQREGNKPPSWQIDDIKFTWEPARFGWAFVLGRAYLLTGNEKYAEIFWQRCEEFARSNPPFMGPNWSSGQETGLRLMALAWCAQIFAHSEAAKQNPGKIGWLANLAAVHAARIPGTLIYARSQNNNHLLTEAAGLFTAGHSLPGHPQADSWKRTGAKWLAWCFEHQIDEQGEYVQHSSNYHRLMLQTALWIYAITGKESFPGGEKSLRSLKLAAGWLVNRLDPISGRVPNLGANDGALIMPFSCSDFSDYRPAARAASRAFLNEELAGSEGEEMSLWFGLKTCEPGSGEFEQSLGIIRGLQSWASLRAVHYTSRPSHADQLHLDLWFRGENIAIDAGTYSYNGQPPWDNSLTSSLVHNTVSINGQDQMTRAGRFLYLDWPEADYLPAEKDQPAAIKSCKARSSAYQRFGILHQRQVMVFEGDRWLVTDQLSRNQPKNNENAGIQPVTCRLHWLLPDLPWKLETLPDGCLLSLQSEIGQINLNIHSDQPISRTGLVRAGELVQGQALFFPFSGWFSPAYNQKYPALSLAVEIETSENIQLESEFSLQVIK